MKILDLQDLPKQDLWEAVYTLNLVSPTAILRVHGRMGAAGLHRS